MHPLFHPLSVKTKSIAILTIFLITLGTLQLFTYLSIRDQQQHSDLLHQSHLQQKRLFAIAFLLNEISDGESGHIFPLQQHIEAFTTTLDNLGAHQYQEPTNRSIQQQLQETRAEWGLLRENVEEYLTGVSILQQSRTAILDEAPMLIVRLFTLGLADEAELLLSIYQHASSISPHQMDDVSHLEQAVAQLSVLSYNQPASRLQQPANRELAQRLRLQLHHATQLAAKLYHKNKLFSALHTNLPRIEIVIDKISESIEHCTHLKTEALFMWEGALTIGSLLILLLVSYYLVNGVTLPLQKLTAVIQQIISSGDRSQRISVEGSYECHQLSHDINLLLQEQQQSLLQMEQSKELLHDMVQSTSDWLWEVNHRGEYTFCSAMVTEFLGYQPEEVLGKTPFDFMPPQEAQRIRAKFVAIVSAKTPFRGLINTHLHRDGHEVIMETGGVPLLSPSGELRGYRGIDRDVTNKVLTERQLKMERNLFLAGRIVAFRWSADDNWSVQYASPNLKNFLGYDAHEWIEQAFPFASLIHADDIGTVINDPHGHAAGGEEFVEHEYRLRHADGSWRWVYDYTSMLQDGQGNTTCYYGYLLDITTRREMEERLRLAATAFETREAIVIVNARTEIQRTNHAFSRVTGYSADEVIGHPISLLSSGHHDRDFYQKMWQELNNAGYWEGEIWNRRKNGEVYPEWLAISAVHDKNGEVANYVGSFQDITDRKEYENQIINHAYYDSLTGLPNRRFLLENLGNNMSRLRRHGHYGALLYFDLDLFKTINDSLGHPVGDELLKVVAERLRSRLRSEDIAARLGGDEFVLLLTEVADSEYDTAIATEAYVSELQKLLAEPCVIGHHTLYISASIGIALYPNDTDSVDDLLKHADVAMYRAKQQGRNTFQFYLPSMQENANKRLLLEREMREAIRNSLFDVHYQPQLDSDHHLIGAEALVRWNHPEQGFISPAEFIPIAEETGLILDIGDFVLRCACRLMKRLEQEGARDAHFAHIAVNVSAKQFMQHDFVEHVLTILTEEQVSTGDIELEITEGVLLHDVNEAIRKMVALREAGIYFSIDDFGTGYSSLSYLSKLPIDKLKIDQSFVRHMGKDPADAAIVETIIAMTRHLGIDVIAEGVETEQELKLLQQQGCHKFQGYHFSRPLADEAFIAFIGQRY